MAYILNHAIHDQLLALGYEHEAVRHPLRRVSVAGLERDDSTDHYDGPNDRIIVDAQGHVTWWLIDTTEQDLDAWIEEQEARLFD